MNKTPIYQFNPEGLKEWLGDNGYKPFRGEQIWKFLYDQKVDSFDEMHNIGKDLQEKLNEQYTFEILEKVVVQQSKDGTIKFLFRLHDNELIETVLMRHAYGNSVCVTTQIGCNIGCSFCASGLRKKERDLLAGEIVAQIMYVQKFLDEHEPGERVSHIVVMGIGEPFDNYDETMQFLRIVNDQKGLAIGARHITVSTSGIVPKIYQFAEEKLQVNLAISLHAPNNEVRSRLMKINMAQPLEKLMPAVWNYVDTTNRRVTFEYIMIDGMNDQIVHAKELVALIPRDYRHLVYVNLIPYNPVVEHNNYERSTEKSMMAFFDVLMKSGIQSTVRREQGSDIDAACGQLRAKKEKER